ncbi:uncharacterized protein [Nicotiana tomentosiformis]|uniref:uncharacterized protein isoform X1 n=1 Tax=Nicotiana tomentosiformis TaxID=4098 RepID=UPI0008786436
MLRIARENNVRPTWILDDIWVKLLEYWKSLKFEKKSRQGRAARMSDKGGSVHTGGSISMAAHRKRLAKGRPVTHDEVFEETHMKKLKDGTKTTWVETHAETTHNNFKQILEEFIQSQPTDDQDRPIQPTQEELMDMWIKAVGGVHKGRAYGLGLEFSLSHRTSGLCGSYSSSHCSIDVDEFEQLNWKVANITEFYMQERAAREEEAKRRKEKDRRREEEERQKGEEMRRKDEALRLVTSDVESLMSQINSLLASGAFPLPRSPALSDDN